MARFSYPLNPLQPRRASGQTPFDSPVLLALESRTVCRHRAPHHQMNHPRIVSPVSEARSWRPQLTRLMPYSWFIIIANHGPSAFDCPPALLVLTNATGVTTTIAPTEPHPVTPIEIPYPLCALSLSLSSTLKRESERVGEGGLSLCN